MNKRQENCNIGKPDCQTGTLQSRSYRAFSTFQYANIPVFRFLPFHYSIIPPFDSY
jgi:hypothetical protein